MGHFLMSTVFSLCVLSGIEPAGADDGNPPAAEWIEVQFKTKHPLGSVQSLAKRFRHRGELPQDYDIRDETFFLCRSERAGSGHGVLVWMGNDLEPDDDVKRILIESRLIWVAPEGTAGHRNEWHRYGLAIDAAVNAVKKYKVDKKRIYIGGEDMAARDAARLAIAYADIFQGVLTVGLIDFYRDLKVPGSRSAASGVLMRYYEAEYQVPRSKAMLRARVNSRFVFVIPDDLTQEDYLWCVVNQGFRDSNYQHVTTIERPRPELRFDAEVLAQAIRALDAPLRKRK